MMILQLYYWDEKIRVPLSSEVKLVDQVRLIDIGKFHLWLLMQN